jgi:membrane protease YdiL (CAAX protease family)
MDEQQTDGAVAKPLWRRIVDFPLVALVIAVGLFAVPLVIVNFGKAFLPATPPTSTLINSATVIVLELLIYKQVIAKLGERPRDELPWSKAPTGLGVGLLGGFLLFSAVVGVAAIADVYNIVGQGGTSQLLTALVVMAIMPGFTEELLFRGILFRWIEEFGGSWAALLLTSALFGFAHIFNPNAGLFSSFAIAMEAGLMFGGIYMLTRNIWVPMGLHAAWNFTQGEIWDVPVSGLDQNGLVQAQLSGPEILSGGAFGLEASLFALILCTAVGVWLVALAIKRGQLVQPWWVRRRLAQPAPEVIAA